MGIEHMIIVARNDAWGDGNYETMKELYEAEGGLSWFYSSLLGRSYPGERA